MRETQFPVISLGSEKPDAPAAAELSKWIADQRGKTADLTSFELETTLAKQGENVSEPCAAGGFYADRMKKALGITGDRLPEECTLSFDEISADLDRLLKIRRQFRCALPLSCIKPAAFSDEAQENYAAALKSLCRFMRDRGAAGHVFCGEPAETILEFARGPKYIWVCEAEDFETLLETTSTLVCTAADIKLVEELNETYLIRKVLVKDADRTAMERLLETFDADRLCCAGIAPALEPGDYWKSLADVTARLTDK
ncbi:MAG TPA: hypothetical protein O0X70_08090 [Methanocorpusculum sp.]|nr:hypothetical protein [Methanocorpusculum sp.]